MQEGEFEPHQVRLERIVVGRSSLLSVIKGARELCYALSRVDSLNEGLWAHGLKINEKSSKARFLTS